jgi:hypothetical protein
MKWVLHFVATVWKMRRHQRAWFRLHKQSDLIEAKKFEKQVDAEILMVSVMGENGPTALKDNFGEEPSELKQNSLFELGDKQ